MPRLRSQTSKDVQKKSKEPVKILATNPESPKVSKYFSTSSSAEVTPEKKAVKRVRKKKQEAIISPPKDHNGNKHIHSRESSVNGSKQSKPLRESKLVVIKSDEESLSESDTEEAVKTKKKKATQMVKPRVANSKKTIAKDPEPEKKHDQEMNGASLEAEHSESEEEEWEEVEMDGGQDAAPSTSSAGMERLGSTTGVEDIEISLGSRRIKEKKDVDAETALRREINRYRKKQLEEIHKAHLLCYIAHGKLISKTVSATELLALALSLIPVGFIEAREDDRLDSALLKKFLKWFQSGVILQSGMDVKDNLKSQLRACLESKAAPLERDLIAVLVCMFRSLGLDVRLITSVHPAALKLPPDPSLEGPSSKKKKTDPVEESGKKPKKKGPPPRKSVRPDSDNLPLPDYWVEVYLDSEERWIAVDPVRGCFNDPDGIESRCKPPVLYVLGFDNENAVRDLTTRYCSGYLSSSVRNMRCNHDWWAETLAMLKTKKHPLRDRLEDVQLEDLLLKQPLPTTIAEVKNHPLYVLMKDIKKFEAIYPQNTKRIGYVRGIEVFPRNSVHLLRAKETWLKEARLIRVGETPYKIVKARPKMGVPKEEQQDRPLPLFGFWQTEPYIPKPAVNGVIPRNQYGNVDFFKPEMLPPGTVHLPMPGLLSIAKKLDVDCAPAMVGWDFTGRGSFPVFDGWIVCEEHKEALLAAWDHCDSHQEQKRAQKRTEKALENWRKLTRGLIIGDKVRRKYLLTKLNSSEGTSSQAQRDKEDKEGAEDSSLTAAWPQNQHQFTIDEYDETL